MSVWCLSSFRFRGTFRWNAPTSLCPYLLTVCCLWAHSCLCCDLLTLLAYAFLSRPCGVSHINRPAVTHYPLTSLGKNCGSSWLQCLSSNGYNFVLNGIYFLVNSLHTRDLLVSFAAGGPVLLKTFPNIEKWHIISRCWEVSPSLCHPVCHRHTGH